MSHTMFLKLSTLSIMEGVVFPAILDLLKRDIQVSNGFLLNTRMDVRAPQGLFHAVACQWRIDTGKQWAAHGSNNLRQLATGHRFSKGSSPGR